MSLNGWLKFLLGNGFKIKIFDPRKGKSSYFDKNGFCVRVSDHMPNLSNKSDYFICINKGKAFDNEYKKELLEKMEYYSNGKRI